jgi:hypothetical protein
MLAAGATWRLCAKAVAAEPAATITTADRKHLAISRTEMAISRFGNAIRKLQKAFDCRRNRCSPRMRIVSLAASRRSVGACSHWRNLLFENIFPFSHDSESRYRIDVHGCFVCRTAAARSIGSSRGGNGWAAGSSGRRAGTVGSQLASPRGRARHRSCRGADPGGGLGQQRRDAAVMIGVMMGD